MIQHFKMIPAIVILKMLKHNALLFMNRPSFSLFSFLLNFNVTKDWANASNYLVFN